MLLKITFQNQLRALSFHLIGTSMMLLVLWWFKFDEGFTLIFGIIWVIYTVPALYLHIEYYLRNRQEAYSISNQEITLVKKGNKTSYKASDIREIIIYMAPNVIKGNYFRYLPVESYYFARIKLEEGRELIITCLLTHDLRNVMKRLEVEHYFEQERLFCSLLIKD